MMLFENLAGCVVSAACATVFIALACATPSCKQADPIVARAYMLNDYEALVSYQKNPDGTLSGTTPSGRKVTIHPPFTLVEEK